jgi:hypothetical protein
MGRPTRHSLSRISLAFPERYPSPVDARGLSEARLRSFLAREHYTGSQKPAELMVKLRRAAHGSVGELELSTRRALVLSLVAALKTLNAQIRDSSAVSRPVCGTSPTVRSSCPCSKSPAA